MANNIFLLLIEYPFLPVYLIAVIMAVWRFPRYYDTELRFLPVFLTYTLATEILGVVTYEFEEISFFLNELFSYYNWLIYNIYLIVFCAYFYYVYYRVIPARWARTPILVGAFLMGAVTLVNPLYQSFQYEVQLGAYVIGGIVLVVSAALYLVYRRSRSGRPFTSRDLLSWISLGLILFYSGFIPISIIRYTNDLRGLPDPVGIRFVLQALIFVMYGCFMVGFWRMRRLRVFLNE